MNHNTAYEILPGAAGELPLMVRSKLPTARINSLDSGQIQRWITEYGAILIRGFRFNTRTFAEFSSALCSDFILNDSKGRQAISVQDRIQTVNKGVQAFPLHAEMARVPWQPDLAFFACVQPPAQGGETLACDGHAIYHDLDPKLREQLTARSLLYREPVDEGVHQQWCGVTFSSDPPEPGHRQNSPWTFDREDGQLYRSFTAPVFAATISSGSPAFANFLLFARFMVQTRTFPLFENGDEIPDALCAEIQAVAARHSFAVKWQKHDVLVLDNCRFMHGRNAVVNPLQRNIWTRFGFARFAAAAPQNSRLRWWQRYREIHGLDVT